MATSGVSQQVFLPMGWPCRPLGRIASWDRSSLAMASSFGFCSQRLLLISDLGEVGRKRNGQGWRYGLTWYVAGTTGPQHCDFCSEDRWSL